MVAQKEDYRTNRADYLVARMQAAATAKDGPYQLAERKKRLLALGDRRLVRLAANPCESKPGPTGSPRGGH
jgi:hypothetical protein